MITRLIALLLTLGVVLGDLPAFAAGLARLTELKGDVQVMPQGGTWHAGAPNEELDAGATVKTGAQSGATVVRKDGTELELMPFAQLAIEDENGFLLSAGRVWSHFVKSLGLPFFIRTPNATALIRGTTLGVGFEDERSRVVVYEGLVEVQDREGGHQNVAGGFRVDVDRMGRLERLERAGTRELDEGRRFRVRRGLEDRPDKGLPGRQGERGRDHERGGPEHERPARDRMERPGMERVEGVERRMERVERRIGERLELREEREAKEREHRQEAVDTLKRQIDRNDRQERQEKREEDHLRDLLPEATP